MVREMNVLRSLGISAVMGLVFLSGYATGAKKVVSDYFRQDGNQRIVEGKEWEFNVRERDYLESKIEECDNSGSNLEAIANKSISESVSRVDKEDELSNGESIYGGEDYENVARILYAEAANQPKGNKQLIVKCILNRIENDGYPDNLEDNLFTRNAFSCTLNGGSDMWKEANDSSLRNGYEESVYQKCRRVAKNIMDGCRPETISRDVWNSVIAYHDVSIEKRKDSYWDSLELIYENDRLKFYGEK